MNTKKKVPGRRSEKEANRIVARAIVSWDECESPAKTPYALAAMRLNVGRQARDPIENVNTVAQRIAQAGGLKNFLTASGVAPDTIPDAVRRVVRAQPL